jgi:AraC-like DNA-binding protein
MSLADLDSLLRGASLGFAALFALLVARLPDRQIRWLGLGLAASVFAFLLLRGPYAASWPDGYRLALRLLAIPGVYFLWALSRRLFEDRFSPRPWHAFLVAAMLAAATAGALLAGSVSPLAQRLLRLGIQLPALALAGHILWRALRDRGDDLVEPRRRLRLLFFGAGAAFTLVSVFPRWLWDLPSALLVPRGSVAQAAAQFLAGISVAAFLFELRRPAFLPAAGARPETGEAGRVIHAMRTARIYRETGITIGALAGRLRMPEYRLRRVINGQLGYRNFNDFLNTWRLPEAAERLRDPAQAHLPILSIALDTGYGSIGPFNRAFKAAMGVTPSEYRRRPAQAPAES